MLNVLWAIILGLIQGLTEFLPVSSSGHLLLLKKLFNMDVEQFGLSFDIALHAATLVAVMIVFRKDIMALLRRPVQKYVGLLIIATIPGAIAGVLLEDVVEGVMQKGTFLGIAFLLTAAVLFVSEKTGRRVKDSEDITYSDAALVGFAQAAAAVVPGLSRSGSTLGAGLARGLKKGAALKFSFLMSIPIILGSTVLGVKKMVEAPVQTDWIALLCGMLAAGVSGYFAIRFMLDFFKKRSLRIFAIYVAVLGIFILIDQIFFGHFFQWSF